MTFLRKSLRIIGITLLCLVLILFVFLIFAIGPVNRHFITETDAYRSMLLRLESVKYPEPDSRGQLYAGFAKANITPSFPAATAGYAPRRGRDFPGVIDSLFVRTLIIGNGNENVAIVSADLLIMPPEVIAALPSRLQESGFTMDKIYFGATHTHNGVGNWSRGATGFIYGDYDQDVVDLIADAISKSIEEATRNLLPATLRTAALDNGDLVQNRVIKDGPEDPFLRVVEARRSDSSRLILATFSAHATCLYSEELRLSRDYPGKFVEELERNGYEFAMFMAGAVGSHRCTVPKYGPECIEWMGEGLAKSVTENRHAFEPLSGSGLSIVKIPLALPDPQVKITESLKVRPWLFRAALGEYPAKLTALRIGDLVMLGTPCDYSGEFHKELDSFADSLGVTAMVTGFNGGYLGYITPQEYFDIDHYETRLMNWYPPGTGEYITLSLKEMLAGISAK